MQGFARTAAFSAVLLLGATTADSAINTGPEIGAKIPDFEARDQNGKLRTLADLTGPEGLMLLFYRTADW